MALTAIQKMTTWTEFMADYKLVETADEVSGTRAFFQSSTGTDKLPTIGKSEFDTDHKNVLCRRLTYDIFYPDPANRSKWLRKIVCDYSTESGGDDYNRRRNKDDRRFQLGGEIIEIKHPTTWKWTLSTDDVTSPVFLTNVMGTFTRQRSFSSTTAKDQWIQDVLIQQFGTINSLKFEGWRIGSVLFSGMSGGTQFEETGRQIWVFDLEFTYRIIRSAGGLDYDGDPIIENDWLYAYNDAYENGADHSGWDQPYDTETNKYAYDSTDLNAIFRGDINEIGD